MRIAGIVLFLVLFPVVKQVRAQTGEIYGQILNPSGALVQSADLVLSHGNEVSHAKSDHDGRFLFRRLAPGSYSLSVLAPGFGPLSVSDVTVLAGQNKELNLTLSIAVQRQEVTVPGETNGVSINPDQNASALVLRGDDLDALSDDADELQSQLQALAGPGAEPNGGQIYIDGFTGGQLPPKSSIREIRINQNPFSAEFDRIGYGRIKILTKPGSDKFHGQFSSYGTSAVLNTANPLVQQQPPYYLYALQGNVSGPLTKNASYFLAGVRLDRQNQNVVDAINPQNPATSLAEAIPNPSSLIIPRVDVQLGKSNTLTLRDSYYRNVQTGSGVGARRSAPGYGVAARKYVDCGARWLKMLHSFAWSIADSMIDQLRVETSSSMERRITLFNGLVVPACGRYLRADVSLLVRVVWFPVDGVQRDGKWGNGGKQ